MVVGVLPVGVGDGSGVVGVLPAGVGDGSGVVGALPQTGSPGTGPSSSPPAKNAVGAHTPALPSPTHAHRWLTRFPTEYFDPSDWHRNSCRPAGKALRGSVVLGRYAGAVWVTVQA